MAWAMHESIQGMQQRDILSEALRVWMMPLALATEWGQMWMKFCCGPDAETDRGNCEGQLPVPDAFQHCYDSDLFA